MVRRIVRGLIVLAILGALAAAGAWLYSASRHVPDFYAEALRPAVGTSTSASQELQRPAAVLSTNSSEGKIWRGTFSDDQINKFLAVDLPQKHPDVLPPGIHEPRVSIRQGQASIGWRAEGGWSAIYSLVIVPYVPRPNVLAIRIKRIRAGALPVPLGEVVDGVSQAVRQANLRLQWQQVDGDPVALVELPMQDDGGRTMVLDAVDLKDGEIVVSGHVEEKAEELEQADVSVSAEERAADHSGSNESRQH